ncbi:E3 ubiquitin-protein ligase TRIM21-like [Gambusia affinis]|uniref:E3 ubiquitin-protein ligase TRIM21-like n=1 Tax=Gambusia affinis TaxID=33528 RepID=UPI001CDC092E|nr:E3 ubiquitin-protein ligase TRIM21-like [Gambusia affinis]XP_043991196.1 E3 ubiquitin-protein ligase TRIM21-like [Gambusia affinis]XP_043991197.1 E3 ubiquitin-protein ligase TRIM21-like [Gambusia affinis]
MKKEDILNTLKKLGQKEFDELKWFLEQPETLPELPAISKQHLEGANVLRVVDLMVQTYTLDRCREVFFTILKKINRNDLRLGLLKDWMRKTEAEVQEMIQERRLKIQEIRESVKISKDAADREKAEGVQVFRALIESAERGLKELLKEIQDKQETTEKQAEDFIRDLEQEISELKKRSSEVKQLSQDEDHLHLLQSFSSLKDAPPTKTWTEVRVHPPSYEETVVKALALFEQNKEKILELKRIQQFAVDVTLDPDTAHPNLILSDDGKQVKLGDERKNLPDNPERFSYCVNVLGQQSFSSGRFYFEVQVKGKTNWDLGVARESINRKGKINLNPQNGFWTVVLRNGNEYLAFADSSVRLHLHPGPQKVGVFVDYQEGLVSFYDVDAAALIYSFTGCCFKEKLYPYFSPFLNQGGTNSAPLIICPVNQAGC